MKLIRGWRNMDAFAAGCALTIGNFDAVHIGHRAILRQLTAAAAARGLPAAVLTFDPHPQEFFAAQKNHAAAPRLTAAAARFFALRECGVNIMLSVKFNRAVADTPAEVFVREILHARLHVRHLLIGDDFRFGAGRAGDADLLQQLAADCGFSVQLCDRIARGRRRVSSTWIRELLAAGQMRRAAQLLGRGYACTGRVMHGHKRGRRWGFPTINLAIGRRPPLAGIFAVTVDGLGEAAVQGVASLGVNPTVQAAGARPVLEVYLFDYSGDAYGKRVCVTFCDKIRDEKTFADSKALRLAIQEDVRIAREIFAATTES